MIVGFQSNINLIDSKTNLAVNVIVQLRGSQPFSLANQQRSRAPPVVIVEHAENLCFNLKLIVVRVIDSRNNQARFRLL